MKEIISKFIEPFPTRGRAFFMPACRTQNAAFGAEDKLIGIRLVIEKPDVSGLFKNVQMQGAQKTEPRGVYEYTLSGAI